MSYCRDVAGFCEARFGLLYDRTRHDASAVTVLEGERYTVAHMPALPELVRSAILAGLKVMR